MGFRIAREQMGLRNSRPRNLLRRLRCRGTAEALRQIREPLPNPLILRLQLCSFLKISYCRLVFFQIFFAACQDLGFLEQHVRRVAIVGVQRVSVVENFIRRLILAQGIKRSS